MCCMYTVYSGMQEWVIQIPSIPILVSVLFPSLNLKYFRIKFLLLASMLEDETAISSEPVCLVTYYWRAMWMKQPYHLHMLVRGDLVVQSALLYHQRLR